MADYEYGSEDWNKREFGHKITKTTVITWVASDHSSWDTEKLALNHEKTIHNDIVFALKRDAIQQIMERKLSYDHQMGDSVSLRSVVQAMVLNKEVICEALQRKEVPV